MGFLSNLFGGGKPENVDVFGGQKVPNLPSGEFSTPSDAPKGGGKGGDIFGNIIKGIGIAAGGVGSVLGGVLGSGVGYQADDDNLIQELNAQSNAERKAAQTQQIILILIVFLALGGILYFILKGKKK